MKRIFAMTDGFFLSWPSVALGVLINLVAVWFTLSFPYTNETLHNATLLMNALGMTASFKAGHTIWQFKRRRKAEFAKMSADAQAVLDKVRPQLDEVFEAVFENEMTEETMMAAAEKAQQIIQKGFEDLDKSRSSESTPDKP